MATPKFSFDSTHPLNAEPKYEQIHSGQALFSTQNVAVYPDYVLVSFQDRVLCIKEKCSKAFCQENSIALLTGNLLRIYTDMQFKTSYLLSDKLIDIICDFIPEEMLIQLTTGRDISTFFNGETPISLFSPSGTLMPIFPDKIILNNKEFLNTVHSENGKYLVAWYDDNIIITNTESEEFIYISGGEQILLEECDALSLRVNDDFDTVHLEDLKVQGDLILLKDSECVTGFKIQNMTKSVDDKKIIWAVVNEKGIDIVDESIKNTEKTDGKTKTSQTELISEEISESQTVNDNILVSDKESVKNEKNSNFGTGDTSMSNLFGLKAALSSSKQAGSRFNVNDTSGISKSSSTGLQTGGTDIERDNMDKLDKLLAGELQALKDSFAKLKYTKSDEVEFIRYQPMKYNLQSLYNKIYQEDLKEYEDILNGMIVSAEIRQGIQLNNVEESIKYFERRIKARGHLAGLVKYKSPLAARFTAVLDVSGKKQQEPSDGITGGQVMSLRSLGTFDSQYAVKQVQEVKQSQDKPVEQESRRDTPEGNASRNDRTDNKIEETRSLTQENTAIETSPGHTEELNDSTPSQPSLFSVNEQVQNQTTTPQNNMFRPLFESSAGSSLFGQQVQEQPNTLFSKNNSGSGLFLENPLNKPPVDNNEQPEGSSALSRFANSRRMFR